MQQQAQALSQNIQNQDEEYYERFEEYLELTYFDPQLNLPYIRFYSPTEQWYAYNPTYGYYETLTDHEITKIILDWAAIVSEVTSDTKIRHIFTRMRAYLEYKGTWDNGHYQHYAHIVNTKSGLLDTESLTLLAHSPEYMSRRQIPRHFIPNTRRCPAPLRKILWGTPDQDSLLKALIAIVKNIHDDEFFLMLYGQKHSGKSTTLQILENILGVENISKTSLFKLGGTFGLKECHDKLINIYPDLPIAPMNPYVVGTLKTLTGEDGYLEIEFKKQNPFKYPVQVFFGFGTNQLPEFRKDCAMEMESVMRRACLVHYPNVQPHDPHFKRSIKDPRVLDEIFSYLVHIPYMPLYLPCELEDWVQNNTERWLDNSSPVIRTLKELYFYCDVAGLSAMLPIRTVVEEVQESLAAEGYMVADLQSEVTESFRAMKIYRNSARGAKAAYLKVMRHDHPDADKYKAKMKEPKVAAEKKDQIEDFLPAAPEPVKEMADNPDVSNLFFDFNQKL
jgi:energy-coupling factor transporter ATP-binding protein EcfA2